MYLEIHLNWNLCKLAKLESWTVILKIRTLWPVKHNLRIDDFYKHGLIEFKYILILINYSTKNFLTEIAGDQPPWKKFCCWCLNDILYTQAYQNFQAPKEKKEGDPYVKNWFWKSYNEITDF